MAANLDRAAFFAGIRKAPFGGSLSQGQVAGAGSILSACPPDLDTDALAYCLATSYHETAATMLPVKEYGGAAYYTRMYDIAGERPAKARELGNLTPGDGAKFCGRGYVQLTGRSNYRRATDKLRARGYLIAGQDLTVTPDLAMNADIAAAIMFLGMQEGWFTGQRLAQYFGPGRAPIPVQARRIINGLDRAESIAAHFRSFQAALRLAGHAPGKPEGAVPVPKVDAKPLPPLPEAIDAVPVPKLPPAPPNPSPVARLGNWLASKLSLPWSG